jgi:hypothetical protein
MQALLDYNANCTVRRFFVIFFCKAYFAKKASVWQFFYFLAKAKKATLQKKEKSKKSQTVLQFFAVFCKNW